MIAVCCPVLCCAVLCCVQAKGTEAGAAEPLSDEDMEDAEGAVRMEGRQRGKRGRGGGERAGAVPHCCVRTMFEGCFALLHCQLSNMLSFTTPICAS